MVELSAAACPDLGARKAQPLIVADHRLVEDLAFELDARVCAAEQQQQRHAAEAAAHAADDLFDRRDGRASGLTRARGASGLTHTRRSRVSPPLAKRRSRALRYKKNLVPM